MGGKPAYEAALAKLCEMYPEEAPQLQKYSSDLIACAMGAADPPHIKLVNFAAPLPPAFAHTQVLQAQSLSPCTIAICTFLAQAVGIVLSILGLPKLENEILINVISSHLGGDVLSGFARMIKAFSDAPAGSMAKAKAFCNIISRFYNVGGQVFMDIIKQSVHKMHFWQWAKVLLQATAQILAWVATDFLGMAAEVVLILSNVPDLYEAAAAVGRGPGASSRDRSHAAGPACREFQELFS